MSLLDDDVIQRIAAVASGPEAKEDRARKLAELIRSGTTARWVGIYTVAGGQVVNDAWSGPGAPAHPTFPATQGLTAHAIATASTVVSNDVTSDPRYLSNQDDSGSELIVPVLLGDRVVGTLDVESDRIDAFSEREVTGFEQIAAVMQPLWSEGSA
jgi:L-methionine (R)-S-oxide reductase